LYRFWGDDISTLLKKDMAAAGSDVLVNLASQEYFRAVRPSVLDRRIVTPIFEDEKQGKFKIISFYAKKARGLMAAWILRERIEDVEALACFNVAGYRFVPSGSDADTLLFRRKEKDIPAACTGGRLLQRVNLRCAARVSGSRRLSPPAHRSGCVAGCVLPCCQAVTA